jgi:hypothetical protein
LGKKRSGRNLVEPSMYRICILGTLDKKWAEYYGGIDIENVRDPKRDAITILTCLLADQSALIGVLTALFDIGYPLLSVEYLGAAELGTKGKA